MNLAKRVPEGLMVEYRVKCKEVSGKILELMKSNRGIIIPELALAEIRDFQTVNV